MKRSNVVKQHVFFVGVIAGLFTLGSILIGCAADSEPGENETPPPQVVDDVHAGTQPVPIPASPGKLVGGDEESVGDSQPNPIPPAQPKAVPDLGSETNEAPTQPNPIPAFVKPQP